MKGYVAALAKVYSLKGMKEQAVSLFTPKAKGGRRIGFHPDRRMVGYLLKAHASIGDAEGVRFWLNFQEESVFHYLQMMDVMSAQVNGLLMLLAMLEILTLRIATTK